MNQNMYANLGKNIKGLRKRYGRTLVDVSADTDISVAALSQYESGKEIPPRDRLVILAKYFRVTENALIYGDYSNAQDITSIPINNPILNADGMNKLLPIICSDSAMENEHFKKAYSIHKQQHELILTQEDVDEDKLNSCLELYEKAKEVGVVEGAANQLCILMLYGLSLSIVNSSLINSVELLHGKEGTLKDIIDGILHSVYDDGDEDNQEFVAAKKEFLDEHIVDFYVNVALLKATKQYTYLGDYYIALMYLFDLILNDMSSEANASFGLDLLHNFSLIGNPYAKQFSTHN